VGAYLDRFVNIYPILSRTQSSGVAPAGKPAVFSLGLRFQLPSDTNLLFGGTGVFSRYLQSRRFGDRAEEVQGSDKSFIVCFQQKRLGYLSTGESSDRRCELDNADIKYGQIGDDGGTSGLYWDLRWHGCSVGCLGYIHQVVKFLLLHSYQTKIKRFMLIGGRMEVSCYFGPYVRESVHYGARSPNLLSS